MQGRGTARQGDCSWLLRARREKARLLSSYNNRQQQPATRHRSTVRRLVSKSSMRADTVSSLPNGDGHQANSGASADRRSSALGTPAARYRCRPSASKMNVVGSDRTERRSRGRRIVVHIDFHVGHVAKVVADLVDDAAHLVARRAPGALKCTTVGPCRDKPRSLVSTSSARLRIGRPERPERRVSSHPITAASASAATTATIAPVNGRFPCSQVKSCLVKPIEGDG